MTIGTAVQIECGKKDPSNLYVQCKNKSVYKFNRALTPAGVSDLTARIKSSGNKVQLKHWIKVR